MTLEPIDADSLPASMRAARRWLVWRSVPHPNPTKKPRKVPYYVSGKMRHGRLDDDADRAQLASFDEACAALASGQYTGLGFALGPDGTGNHWQGVDLDDLAGRPELAILADDGLPGYTESSPSGNGLHAIGYGRPFPALGSNGSGIEAYCAGRFFTVTGEGAGLGEPVDLHDYVTRTLAPKHDRSAAPAPDNVAEYVDPRTLAELRSALASMRADDRDLWVANGQRLKRLGERGRALWMEWSQTSDKFDPADAARVWDSFTADRTGYQAVFAEAQRRGWVNPMSGVAPAPAAAPPPLALPALDSFLTPFTADELTAAAEPHPHAFMAEDGRGLFPEGEVTVIGAPGREGKTTAVMAIATHYALGRPLSGMAPAEIRSAIIYSAEDDRPQYARKAAAQWCRMSSADQERFRQNLIVPDLHGPALAACREIVTVAGRQPVRGSIVEPLIEAINALRERECPPGLVIFETASTLSDAEEDNPGHKVLIAALKHLAKQTGTAVVLVHHTSQAAANNLPDLQISEADIRGGTTLVNNARQTHLVVNLGSMADPFSESDARTLLRGMVAPGEKDRVTAVICLSSSKSADPAPLFFRWEDTGTYGPRMVEIDPPADLRGKSWRAMRAAISGARVEAREAKRQQEDQTSVQRVIDAVTEIASVGGHPTLSAVAQVVPWGKSKVERLLAVAVSSGALVRAPEKVPRAPGMPDVYRPKSSDSSDSSGAGRVPWANHRKINDLDSSGPIGRVEATDRPLSSSIGSPPDHASTTRPVNPSGPDESSDE